MVPKKRIREHCTYLNNYFGSHLTFTIPVAGERSNWQPDTEFEIFWKNFCCIYDGPLILKQPVNLEKSRNSILRYHFFFRHDNRQLYCDVLLFVKYVVAKIGIRNARQVLSISVKFTVRLEKHVRAIPWTTSWSAFQSLLRHQLPFLQ